jgi:hypothetical protein
MVSLYRWYRVLKGSGHVWSPSSRRSGFVTNVARIEGTTNGLLFWIALRLVFSRRVASRGGSGDAGEACFGWRKKQGHEFLFSRPQPCSHHRNHVESHRLELLVSQMQPHADPPNGRTWFYVPAQLILIPRAGLGLRTAIHDQSDPACPTQAGQSADSIEEGPSCQGEKKGGLEIPGGRICKGEDDSCRCDPCPPC